MAAAHKITPPPMEPLLKRESSIHIVGAQEQKRICNKETNTTLCVFKENDEKRRENGKV